MPRNESSNACVIDFEADAVADKPPAPAVRKPGSKPISAKTLVAVSVAAAKGTSRRKIMADHVVPERLVRALQEAKLGQDEFRAAMAVELESAASEAVAAWRKALADGKVSPSTLPIAAAVYLDKAGQLTNRASLQNAQINVQVNNYGSASKEEIIAALTNTATSTGAAVPPALLGGFGDGAELHSNP